MERHWCDDQIIGLMCGLLHDSPLSINRWYLSYRVSHQAYVYHPSHVSSTTYLTHNHVSYPPRTSPTTYLTHQVSHPPSISPTTYHTHHVPHPSRISPITYLAHNLSHPPSHTTYLISPTTYLAHRVSHPPRIPCISHRPYQSYRIIRRI